MIMIIWVYGEPCSGKTTLARELAKETDAVLIDSHDIREKTGNWDLSKTGRWAHLRYILAMVDTIADYKDVVVCAVTPTKLQRKKIKEDLSAHGIEIVLASYKPEDLKKRQFLRFGYDFKSSGFEYG